MKCSAAWSFLSQINHREEPITSIPSADLDYLSVNGYILRTTKEDYDKGVADVTRLSQMIAQVNAESAEEKQAEVALQQHERREHSFSFHFEGKAEKDELRERIQSEAAVVSREEAELSAMEANVNGLIQEKSMIDRMVAYDGGYLSLTGLGTIVLNDLNIRNYRAADQEFPDFVAEIKATYAELRSIADKATSYVIFLEPKVPPIEDVEYPEGSDDDGGDPTVGAPSLLWGTAIGLAKLRGDTNQIGERFVQALNLLQKLDSTTPNMLMAA